MAGLPISPARTRVALLSLMLAAGSAMVSGTPVFASVNFVSSFNGYGSGTNLFNQPLDMAVSSAGVYVVDSGNNQIQQFDSTGNFIRKWGSLGSGNGQFNSPKAVAID